MPTNEFAGGRLNSYTNHVRNICHINGALRRVCVSVCVFVYSVNNRCGTECVCDYLSIRHSVTSKRCAILVAYHLRCDDDPCVRLISEHFHFLIFVSSSELPAALSILLFCSYIEFKIV